MPRVLTARFMHETNTFSRVKTDMALIRRRDFHLENEIPQAFRGTRTGGGTAAAPLGWDIATRHRAGTAQVALFQRGIKRILVHDRRPRDVDQQRFTATTPVDLAA